MLCAGFTTRRPGLRLSTVAHLYDVLVGSQQLPHGSLVWTRRALGVCLTVEHGECQGVHAAVHARGDKGLWAKGRRLLCIAHPWRAYGVYYHQGRRLATENDAETFTSMCTNTRHATEHPTMRCRRLAAIGTQSTCVCHRQTGDVTLAQAPSIGPLQCGRLHRRMALIRIVRGGLMHRRSVRPCAIP